MDPILFADAARAGHMLGMGAGLALALCAMAVAVKSLFRPVSRMDVRVLRWMHRAILTALGLLWASGLSLIYLRTGFDPALLSPSLAMKLAAAVLLSASALAMGLYALPCYAAHTGRRFSDFSFSPRLRLSAAAGFSLSCWAGALALGGFSQLQAMPFGGLAAVLLPIFAIGPCGAIVIGLGATGLIRLSALLPSAKGENDPRLGPSLVRVATRMIFD